MEVNKKYIKFLLKLLNKKENSEEKIDTEKYQEELIVNLYLTLLSLSDFECSENVNQKENEEITDFLRKLNNLKVKIQLKRKAPEINKLAQDLINQYYENINILSIYIKDGIELENIINTMDAKSLTTLIDKVTKNKMNKDDRKIEINEKRKDLKELLFNNPYCIKNNKFIIDNKELSINEFVDIFNYLLNPDNYQKIYKNKTNQKNREQIISNITKILILNDKKNEEIDKILIPMILTHILSLDIKNKDELDTSEFNIENIKINELYSLATKVQEFPEEKNKTAKWRNISIPNEYLLEKIKNMVKKGMYYYKDDNFIFENLENNTCDFKISIKIDKLKEMLKNILENELNFNELKKDIIEETINEEKIEIEENREIKLEDDTTTLITREA